MTVISREIQIIDGSFPVLRTGTVVRVPVVR